MTKEIILIAGANGSGKTTFAAEFVKDTKYQYIGADEIASKLAPDAPESVRVQAGKSFFNDLEKALSKNINLVIESTLSGLGLKRNIDRFKRSGYSVTIVFIFLDSTDTCLARIQERVLKGDEMIRILGFLVGSAASIGMMLLLLGVPDINLSGPLIDDAASASVAQTVEAVTADLEAVAIEMFEEVAEFVDDLPTAEPTAEEQAASNSEDADLLSEELTPGFSQNNSQVASFPPEPGSTTASASAIDEASENDLRWHSFWNPFRSEIAANGFVGQLEKVTGLDYRVVKIRTGVYEVTFAYENDTERRTKLSHIASATGLDLPES